MKFEDIIRKISALVAGFVVFMLAAGMYLSLKGFVMNDEGRMVLVKTADARLAQAAVRQDTVRKNIIYPDGHALGRANAPVTIYEYSSLGCFHCADFHLDILPKLKKHYIDNGKVRLVFADFPIDKKSMQAALVAHCMPDNKYFDFVNLLFKNQRSWSLSSKSEKLFSEYAAREGLSPDQVARCLKNEKTAEEIMDVRQRGIEEFGITGTPTLVIKTAGGYEVIPGAPSYDTLKTLLNTKLAEK